jgi:hypothetical protein
MRCGRVRDVSLQPIGNPVRSAVGKQDHDVLMLFDNSLDGIEDSDSQVIQALGMVNLAAQDWFDPFDPEQARDPDRSFRQP